MGIEQEYSVFTNDELKPPSREKSTQSSYLFIALYLVILAFFILLNSISTVKKDKLEEILEGVRGTFSNAAKDYKQKIYTTVNSAGKDFTFTNYQNIQLGKIAKESFAIQDATIIEFGNTSQITTPVDTFFIPNSATIHSSQETFLSNIAEELNKFESFTRVDIELTIGNKKINPPFTNHPETLSLTRTTAFAQTLEKLGVNTAALLVGIDNELNEDKMSIRFYVRNLKENRLSTPTNLLYRVE